MAMNRRRPETSPLLGVDTDEAGRLVRDLGALSPSGMGRGTPEAASRGQGRSRPSGRPCRAVTPHNDRLAAFTQRPPPAAAASGEDKDVDVAAGDVDAAAFDADAEAEAFLERSSATEKLLEEVFSGVRMENLDPLSREGRDEAAQEARRRREEAEKRRAYRKAMEAKNPRRKVEARLTHSRSGGEPVRKDLPFVKYEVEGLAGGDKVRIVDVNIVRARCTAMNEGRRPTVAKLLEIQEDQEKQRRFEQLVLESQRERLRTADTRGSSPSAISWPRTPGAFSTSSLGGSPTGGRLDAFRRAAGLLPTTPASPSGRSCGAMSRGSFAGSLGSLASCDSMLSKTDLQLKAARTRRRAATFDGMLRKLSCTRSVPSENALEAFEALARKVSDDVDVTGLVHDVGEYSGSRSRGFLELAAVDQASPKASPLQQEGRFELCRELAASVGVARIPRLAVLEAERQASEQLFIKGASPAAKRRRLRGLMRCFRGLVRLLCVYFAHMRMTNATDLIKGWIPDLYDSTKFSRAVYRVNAIVTRIQAIGRMYLCLRERRVKDIYERWRRVEDRYLEDYFRRCPPPEPVVAAAAPGGDGAKPVESREGKLVRDWRLLRLPADEAREVCKRLYMTRLHAHVLAPSGKWRLPLKPPALEEAGLSVSTPAADGSGAVAGRELLGVFRDEPGSSRFWHVEEEALSELIALSAYSLRDLYPYAQHPANQEPGEANPLGSIREVLGASHSGLAMMHASKEAGRSLERQRLAAAKRASVQAAAATAAAPAVPRSGGGPPSTLDELFESFTPRLSYLREPSPGRGGVGLEAAAASADAS
eukprot:TRINITY_DN22509_c0_g1_i1.p1 TRINITY_DN22509_c0_g1~~TRINITY_DN22509_c0_g1_i1.p1  ORF type:complete len:820 (-),score=191.38 TRINITY_DN22509_c0_g1_i1:57-2516(-)